VIPEYIYRGDRRGNRQVIDHFRLAGLYTKLINNGNPAYIKEVGLFEAIRIHIAGKRSDEELKSKSHFLSFTSSRERALFYAAANGLGELIPCLPYTESRYLFALHISTCMPKDEKQGIYTLDYESKPDAIEPDSMLPDDVRIAEGFKARLSNEGPRKHTLWLINAVTFLRANPHHGTSSQALTSALKDREWLVLPMDWVDRLHGYSARIPRSSIWTYECLRLSSEQPLVASTPINGGLEIGADGDGLLDDLERDKPDSQQRE
jgi:hypothetical protein